MTDRCFRYLRFRSAPTPTVPVPFGVRSAGHYRVNSALIDAPDIRPFYRFLWGIRGVGVLHPRPGCKFSLGPEEVVFMQPGDSDRKQLASDVWEYRWWTMDGPLAREIVGAFGWTAQTPRRVGPCPTALFLELDGWLCDVNPDAERRATAVATELLAVASGQAAPSVQRHPLVNLTVTAIEEQYPDPAFSISLLARQLHVHRTTLDRCFRKHLGIGPHAYLDRVRLQKALLMLRQERQPIKEIAAAAGYSNASYFATAFRRMTDLSPREFRDRR